MRVIIAGSRNIDAPARLNCAIRAAQFNITEVVCGMAGGVDQMGADWAKAQDPRVPVHPMPADWDTLGKRAGFVRNCEMAKEADALIAIWDGDSNGTRHMITEAVSKGLHHYISAKCSNCDNWDNVAIYRFQQPAKKVNEIRAMCRDCLVRRGADVAFFDVFKMWGNHTLHVTEKRMAIEAPKVALPLPLRAEVHGLKFGQKLKRETKHIRPLPPSTARQEQLFT